jgi:hypothetical protein
MSVFELDELSETPEKNGGNFFIIHHGGKKPLNIFVNANDDY